MMFFGYSDLKRTPHDLKCGDLVSHKSNQRIGWVVLEIVEPTRFGFDCTIANVRRVCKDGTSECNRFIVEELVKGMLNNVDETIALSQNDGELAEGMPRQTVLKKDLP